MSGDDEIVKYSERMCFGRREQAQYIPNEQDIGVDRATNVPLENTKPHDLTYRASHRHKTFLFPAPISSNDHHSSKRNLATP